MRDVFSHALVRVVSELPLTGSKRSKGYPRASNRARIIYRHYIGDVSCPRSAKDPVWCTAIDNGCAEYYFASFCTSGQCQIL